MLKKLSMKLNDLTLIWPYLRKKVKEEFFSECLQKKPFFEVTCRI